MIQFREGQLIRRVCPPAGLIAPGASITQYDHQDREVEDPKHACEQYLDLVFDTPRRTYDRERGRPAVGIISSKRRKCHDG